MLNTIIGAPGSIKRNKAYFIMAIFIPVVLLFIIVRVIPIISTLSMSFTNYHMQRPVTKFVGFRNFSRLIKDDIFLISFRNSMQFVLIAFPAEIILGLAIALMLNNRLRAEGYFQTLFFIPYILPMVPAAIIWQWIYAPGNFGLANFFLESIGFQRVSWLIDSKIALNAIIVMHIWKNLGFFVVIFLVGLKDIPNDFKEAALVDGANTWQRIWRVELPIMKPVILFSSVMASIWALSAFTEVYIMTQGTDVSTGVEISVLVFQIYVEGFRYFRMGYSSAISLILFGVSMLLVLVQFRLFREK